MLRILHGDCTKRLQEIEDCSIDAIVSDPPYGLKFMGKDFDNLGDGAQQRVWHQQWVQQAHRVLKAGGVVKAFSGSRTYHHLVKAMLDAGFERVRVDAWVYGSGFPKSLNVSKAIDKAHGITELKDPVTEDAKTWEGWGTSLKPSFEPVVIGFKPE